NRKEHDSRRLSIRRTATHMLSTMLAAPIREGMSQIFNTPLAYRAALHELHRKYGHPHLVVRSYIQHLMAISLGEGGSNLETFSTQLNGAVATLDAAGYGHELESSVALEGLVSKLPTHLLSRWGRNVTRLFPRVPTLRDLNAWLGFELMGMKNIQGVIPQTKPPTSTIAPPQHSTRQRHQENGFGWTRNSNQSFYRAGNTNKTTQPTVNAVAAEQEVLSKCSVCNDSGSRSGALHSIPGNVGRRQGESSVRLGQLLPLLGAQPLVPRITWTSKSPLKSRPTPSILQVTPTKHRTGGHDARWFAVSPYVRLLVHNGPNVVSTVALLDPGCKTSLISQELALVLNLTGERTKMNLKTFHGQDPKLTLIKTHCQISSTTNFSSKL
ncbi:Uncharacterized protein APZ42_002656, partial [Daphnia magna]